jgi:hypothetical protein
LYSVCSKPRSHFKTARVMKLRIKRMPEELDIAKIAQYGKHQIPIAPILFSSFLL